jgi:hypothetical protein
MKAKFSLSILYLFAGYILIAIILIKITDKIILTPAFYAQSDQSFGALPEQNLLIYQQIHKWVYLFTTLYMVAKFFLITLIIHTGFYLFKLKAAYLQVLKAVISAEFVFFIPAVFKIWYFQNGIPTGQLSEWIYFYPGSVLSLLNYRGTTWVYLFQNLNIFEIIYWFTLAAFLRFCLKTNFDRNLQIILSSYLPAFLFWTVLVTFYTVAISPAS